MRVILNASGAHVTDFRSRSTVRIYRCSVAEAIVEG